MWSLAMQGSWRLVGASCRSWHQGPLRGSAQRVAHGTPKPCLHRGRQGPNVLHLAGVPGLEPRLTEPESVGLPITLYPNSHTNRAPRGSTGVPYRAAVVYRILGTRENANRPSRPDRESWCSFRLLLTAGLRGPIISGCREARPSWRARRGPRSAPGRGPWSRPPRTHP